MTEAERDPFSWIKNEVAAMLWSEEFQENGWEKIGIPEGEMLDLTDHVIYSTVSRLADEKHNDLPEDFRDIPLFADKDELFISFRTIHRRARMFLADLALNGEEYNKHYEGIIGRALDKLEACRVYQTYKGMEIDKRLIDGSDAVIGGERYLAIKKSERDIERTYQNILQLMRDEGYEGKEC